MFGTLMYHGFVSDVMPAIISYKGDEAKVNSSEKVRH
jgi:hypothetical protein